MKKSSFEQHEMLAQILNDLHVPRELLDELSEDQKQLLFCKMREEQVRRYHQREEEEEALGIMTPIINHGKKKKQVTFRLGADGNEWCWIMGETLEHSEDPLNKKMNNENMEIDDQNEQKQLKTIGNTTSNLPKKTGIYYQVHRDERKQIGEISNNIQEARRVFELLESETRRLALSKENEILHKQSRPSTSLSQSDFVDEIFYHRLEQRAKQADQERRDVARRARDYYHRQSLTGNICFDTDNQTIFTMKAIPLNHEKSDDIDHEIPAFPLVTCTEMENKEVNTDGQRSKPLVPLTRADIRQWFCIHEIPYGTFRSPTGQIYPWFHGIISRGYTEQLLSSKPIGSYLIRLSEKIFGYVLSYHASDHCRHLLIEVTPNDHTYRFLGGAKKESFTNLNQLIEKYSNTPIRSNSFDVLRFPCDQLDNERADYADLFLEHNENSKLYESLYISLDTTTSSLQSTTHL